MGSARMRAGEGQGQAKVVMNKAEFLRNLRHKTGEEGIVGSNPVGEDWGCDNRDMLRGIRNSKKRKESWSDDY